MSEGKNSGKAEEIQIPVDCWHDATSLDIRGSGFYSSDQRRWQSPLRWKFRQLLTWPRFFCPSFLSTSHMPVIWTSELGAKPLSYKYVSVDEWSGTNCSSTQYSTKNTSQMKERKFWWIRKKKKQERKEGRNTNFFFFLHNIYVFELKHWRKLFWILSLNASARFDAFNWIFLMHIFERLPKMNTFD